MGKREIGVVRVEVGDDGGGREGGRRALDFEGISTPKLRAPDDQVGM